MGAIIVGEGISIYQAFVTRQGLEACQRGFRLNRSYTPKKLMAVAENITGKKHKARDYQGAIDDLNTWMTEQKAKNS